MSRDAQRFDLDELELGLRVALRLNAENNPNWMALCNNLAVALNLDAGLADALNRPAKGEVQ